MAAHPLLESVAGPRIPHPLAWATPLLPVAASVFGLSALLYCKVQGLAGQPASGLMQNLVLGVYEGLGFVPAFMLCILVLSWSSIWFITGTLDQPWGRLLRVTLAALALALLVNLGGNNPDGGLLGDVLARRLESVLGPVLSSLLVIVAAVAAVLLATDFFFYRYFESLGRGDPATRVVPAGAAPLSAAPEPGVESEAPAALEPAPAVPSWLQRAPVAEFPSPGPAAPPASPVVTPEVARIEVLAATLPATKPRETRVSWRSRMRVSLDDVPQVEPITTPEPPADLAPPAAPPARAALGPEPEPEPEPKPEPAAAAEPDLARDEFVLLEPAVAGAVPGEPEPEPGTAAEPLPEPAAPEAEPTIEIPRPEGRAATRQGSLFGGIASDERLIAEATRLVVTSRRANAAFLRNRLRVRYEEAEELLQALAARGVVQLDPESAQARVLQQELPGE